MRILVGYTRTAEGRAALDHAVAEARHHDAELVVVHSIAPGRREEGEETATYRQEFAQLEKELAAGGVPHRVRELVRSGSPAEDLLAFADEEGVDRIVIGIRRRSPVGKLLLGSNAQQILLEAPCPVTAVKPPRG